MNKKARYILIFVFIAAITGAGVYFVFGNDLPSVRETPDGVFVSAAKTAQIQNYFKRAGYNMLPHLTEKKPVPRIFVRSVPKDFNKEKFDEERPALFYEMLLPVVLKANETVLAEREQILALKSEFDEKGDLTSESMDKLEQWVTRYDVKPSDDIGTLFSALIERADAVSPTLLLAMAAEDSGFGTSRYAREYNAIFNQRDWDGNGAVPDEPQKEGPQYRIKVFPSLYEAVLSQIHYVNTNGYLGNYRLARAGYRRTHNQIRGSSVAYLLINFPYKHIKYPDIISYLISQYKLAPLDLLSLVPIASAEK
ncbi:MAG: glucosaminidase domain-containing protein [Alphaproteobacteria bacterium]|nr:glucosaminidase domain-containing protein [Alphaproteobacteria bacterium]